MFSGKRLSKFDPQDRGLSRLQKHLQRFFPERQLIVRSGERMRTLRLSTNRQAVMATMLAIGFGWTLLSSSLVMNHTEMIRDKNTEIKDARMGYEQLLAQVSIYKGRVAELTADLESSYAASLAVVDKESELLKQKAQQLAEQTQAQGQGKAAAKPNLVSRIKTKAKEAIKDPAAVLTGTEGNVELALDKAKLERNHADAERKAILAELSDLESSMVDVVGHHTKTPFIATDGLEIRQVVLERDMAITERDTLNARVASLEDQIRDMESNQLLLQHRFAEVAETRIASIESSLNITGLDIDLLVRQQQRGARAVGGKGGPFLPVDQMSMNSGPLEESLNRLNAQMDRLQSLQSLLTQIPLDTPLDKFELNSGFGVRKDPFTGQFAQHLGLDMGADYKTPVTATGDGKVVYADWDGNYGRIVEVDHGLGLISRYGHLSKILVKPGDVVTRGTILGQLGCSGRCTGPHVHYEVHHNGKPINPLKFLKAGSDVFKG
ncbi:MAG: peptidoglycan DD-metalloendopeptidase family protein [Rhodospirillaceae bacterium]|nr:peptidoglycan DD-metalloendopeptidase family protein [Rhodospirillaceae bacterium]